MERRTTRLTDCEARFMLKKVAMDSLWLRWSQLYLLAPRIRNGRNLSSGDDGLGWVVAVENDDGRI